MLEVQAPNQSLRKSGKARAAATRRRAPRGAPAAAGAAPVVEESANVSPLGVVGGL